MRWFLIGWECNHIWEEIDLMTFPMTHLPVSNMYTGMTTLKSVAGRIEAKCSSNSHAYSQSCHPISTKHAYTAAVDFNVWVGQKNDLWRDSLETTENSIPMGGCVCFKRCIHPFPLHWVLVHKNEKHEILSKVMWALRSLSYDGPVPMRPFGQPTWQPHRSFSVANGRSEAM